MRKLLLTLVAALCVVTVNARILAVSVGINKYARPGVGVLHLAENDARDFATLINNTGDASVKLLLGKNATKQSIINAMQTMAAAARPDDILVLFFSGHGLKGGMAAYNTNSLSTLVSYKELGAIFRSSAARTKLIMADTCHSGSMRLGKRKGSEADRKRLKDQDILLFLSSRDNETSNEAPGAMHNGLFTHFVLDGMAGNADANADHRITARELFDYVSKRVVNMSRGTQHPVMWGKFDADMIISTYR